jgi:hypothetical protein
MNVQMGAADDMYQNSVTATITGFTPVSDLGSSFAWMSGMTNGGGNAHPRDMWQFELSDPSTISLQRGRSGQNLDYRYFVVELPVGGPPNNLPDTPTNPNPADGATNVPLGPSLSVFVNDADGDTMTVSFYEQGGGLIGTDTVIGSGTADTTWTDANQYSTTYSWYTVADDGIDQTTSPTWSFTTEPELNQPPNTPTDPDPADGATGVSINPTLSVLVSDPNGDTMTVSFYEQGVGLIGTDTNVASGTRASVAWPGRAYDTTYYWYAVANDGEFDSPQSPTWNFTTESEPNNPPDVPSSPSPADGAIDVPLSPSLSVYVNDIDGDTMTVSFYQQGGTLIGTDTVVGSGTATTTWAGADQYSTTYYWYTVADDGVDSTTSPTWSFTTESEPNQPPDVPSVPDPADGATGVSINPTLSVLVSDPNDDSMSVSFYEQGGVLIGTDTNVASGTRASVDWPGRAYETTYSWYTVANDGEFDSPQSPVWSFTTEPVPNNPPNTPTNPNPANGATNVPLSPTLSVDVNDIDGDTMTVYFYEQGNPTPIGTDTVVGSGTASTTWTSANQYETTYSWYTVADDGIDTTQSATWSFTTEPAPNNPPDVPTDPDPIDGATDVSTNPTLSVLVSDPNGDTMTVSFYEQGVGLIGTDTNVASGTRASVNWPERAYETTYYWYAIANDGQADSPQSPTWSFTTEIEPTETNYSEDFEDAIGWEWSTYSSSGYGRNMRSSYSAASGSYGWRMDVTSSGNYNLNELILHVTVSGGSYLDLSYYTREYSDEQNSLAASFSGHYNGDGIAVSTDGTNWVRLWQYPSSVNSWTGYGPIDISGYISINGDVYIKFQQYDNYVITTDGIMWDDIQLATDGSIIT